MPENVRNGILKMLRQIDDRIQMARQMVEQEYECTDVLMELSAVKEDLFSMCMYLLNEDIGVQLDTIMDSGEIGEGDLEQISKLIDIFIK